MQEMLEFTEEKRTLQTCTAEGGTGGPEKTHLWVKGSHSAFHSQRAIGFSSAAHESTELSICFPWRRWGCAQRLLMTYRVHGECSCVLLAEHRRKGSSTGPAHFSPFGYPFSRTCPDCASSSPFKHPQHLGILSDFPTKTYIQLPAPECFGVFWMSSATGEN